MARPALATVSALAELLNMDIVGSDAVQAKARLEQASAIVRAYAGATWLADDGTLGVVPDDIPGVVTAMVERATRNPQALTQETAGPFSRSFGADAAQRLYLTQNDKLVIRAAVGRGSGIGTLSTTRGLLETAPYGDREIVPEETMEGLDALWPS